MATIDDEDADRRRFVGRIRDWIEDALSRGPGTDRDTTDDDEDAAETVFDTDATAEALLEELGSLSDDDLPDGEFLRGGAATAAAPDAENGQDAPHTPVEPTSLSGISGEPESLSTEFDYRSPEEQREAHPDDEFTPGPPDDQVPRGDVFDPVDDEGDDDVVREGNGVYVLPKDTYCERCEHLDDPPGIRCRAPDAEILELEDMSHLRVKGCPIVEAERDRGDEHSAANR